MIRDINSSTRQTSQECNIVYQYLRHRTAIVSPPELIQEFQNLLQQGRNEDSQVSTALEKIIFGAKQQFNLFLSNCFYLILDHWLETSESMVYVAQLFNTFEIINQTRSYDRRRKLLVQLIKNYQQTKYYLQLRAIIAVINPQKIDNIDYKGIDYKSDSSTTTIDPYLVRYPYLYQYFLASDEQFNHLRIFIEKLQNKQQQDFEILLSKHIIYRFRLKQLAKMKLLAKGAGKMITKVDNPSLLSERAFRIALRQYIGKIDHQDTLIERSQNFITENELRHNYLEFKRDLCCFLTSNIQPRNTNYNFKSKFKQKLASIFHQSDAKSLNRTLILQTCRQLFSFLIIDPTVSDNQSRFAELIANLGTAPVMLILIKITLICPESKPDLEKKIGLLVSHYQLQNVQETPWLIKSLEHLLIAFSIYFGNVDVSIMRSALSDVKHLH